jgi:hypothetical protein
MRQDQLFVNLHIICAFLCGPCANKTTQKQWSGCKLILLVGRMVDFLEKNASVSI